MTTEIIMAIIKFVGDLFICAGLIGSLLLLAMRITGRA